VEAFTAEDVPSFNGWIRLSFDSSATIQAGAEVAVITGLVGPHPICRRPSTEIATSAQVPAVRAASKFSGFAVSRTYRQSGYALINPSATQTATVFLSLMDLSGKFVASGTVQIPPQVRLSRYIGELLPETPADFMGTLRVTGTIPIAVGGVNVLFPEGKFTAINTASPPTVACLQIVTPARNPLTNECRAFPTPCDVPDGWTPVTSCNSSMVGRLGVVSRSETGVIGKFLKSGGDGASQRVPDSVAATDMKRSLAAPLVHPVPSKNSIHAASR